MEHKNFLIIHSDSSSSYIEEGVEIIFRDPHRRSFKIIFPDRDHKKSGRKRCDLLCLTPDNYEYYIELKKTFHPKAIKQLINTIEDYSKDLRKRKAYVVYNEISPAIGTGIQDMIANFAEDFEMILEFVKSPLNISL